MDPDGKWTSTRAVLLAAAGQNRWPPAGTYMAATGQDLMAADTAQAFRKTHMSLWLYAKSPNCNYSPANGELRLPLSRQEPR